MSGTREILTFQFGNYANYVGTHWWNTQEQSFSYLPREVPYPINHDVMYREGIRDDGLVSFTPRLLLVDLNGVLKYIPNEGELYEGDWNKEESEFVLQRKEKMQKIMEDECEKQSRDIELVQSAEVRPHVYLNDLNGACSSKGLSKDYQFSETADSWVDYMYARFHSRSIELVRQYNHQQNKHSFDSFTSGATLWSTEQFENDFSDKIRQYVEECDSLQGFHTIFDCENGFGGLATKCMEHVNDEYNRANLAVPLFQPRNLCYENADLVMSDSIRVVNSALAFQQLIEQSSLFTPLCTNNRIWRQLGAPRQLDLVNYKPHNLYHTSAVLAAYLETITQYYRLRSSPENTIASFCSDLTQHGRKMCAAGIALPFQMSHDEDLIDCLDAFEGPLCTPLTPNCKIGTEYVTQTLCVRGIPNNRLKAPRDHACSKSKRQSCMAAYRCETVAEMFQLYLQCSYHASIANVSAIDEILPTKVPFPNELFHQCLTTTGFNAGTERESDDHVESVPIVASMQNSSDIADTIETLHREAKRIKIGKLQRFKAAGLEDDDYQEALEDLLRFQSNYDDNYQL